MLLARDKSQLLIIDVQEKLLAAISGKDRVVERCVRLVRAARLLNVPITLSEQYPQGLGPTVDPIRKAFANDGMIVDKVEFSCLKSEPLRERLHALRRQGRSQVVIGGIEAHVCVAQTAMGLEAEGFEAFVAADAVGSRPKNSRKLALMRLLNSRVDVVDSEMVLFEWLEKAGTPEFKELQALIK
ncbi:MAG: isochorismatase family protein [Methyloceanibacter sp.]|nr:isochorismatase family protein [Methyloceanibacter sp.]